MEKENGQRDRIVRAVSSPRLREIRNELKSWRIRSEEWKELSPRGTSPPRLHSSELMSPRGLSSESDDRDIVSIMCRQNILLESVISVLADLVIAVDGTNARLEEISSPRTPDSQ